MASKAGFEGSKNLHMDADLGQTVTDVRGTTGTVQRKLQRETVGVACDRSPAWTDPSKMARDGNELPRAFD